MREIREGEAIYYVAELPVANTETLMFDVEVTLENEEKPLQVRFQRRFSTD